MFVKFAGGITIPFSSTNGTGAPSHWDESDYKEIVS